jgi:hypothetical protein
MSFFFLKDQPSRRKRRGVFLRVNALTPEVKKKLIDTKIYTPGSDIIDWVSILEVHPKGKVLLEVRIKRFWDIIKHYPGGTPQTLVTFEVDEDPEWVCEGEVGRGLAK